LKIAIAGDSVGIELAKVLCAHVAAQPGMSVAHLSLAPDGREERYAEIAERVCRAILSGEFERGILCCGTGIGMAMSANKVPGIRAAQTHDSFSAERAARSNDAHVVTLGARVVGAELAKTIVSAWLASHFDPEGASAGNVEAIMRLEQRCRLNP